MPSIAILCGTTCLKLLFDVKVDGSETKLLPGFETGSILV